VHPYGTDPVFLASSQLYDPELIDQEAGQLGTVALAVVLLAAAA